MRSMPTMQELERLVMDDPCYSYDGASSFKTTGQGDVRLYGQTEVTVIGEELETEGELWVWVWHPGAWDVMPYVQHELTETN